MRDDFRLYLDWNKLMIGIGIKCNPMAYFAVKDKFYTW